MLTCHVSMLQISFPCLAKIILITYLAQIRIQTLACGTTHSLHVYTQNSYMQPYLESPNTSTSATLLLPPFCCHLPGHQATLLLTSPWISNHSSVASLDIKPLFCCHPGYQATLLLPPWISSQPWSCHQTPPNQKRLLLREMFFTVLVVQPPSLHHR